MKKRKRGVTLKKENERKGNKRKEEKEKRKTKRKKEKEKEKEKESTSASSEHIIDIPVPHGGPHLQDLGLASLSHEVAGEAFQGVFSTFPRRKKVRR